MKKNKLIFLNLIFLLLFSLSAKAEKIILSSCDNKKDGFLKN